MCGPYFNLNAQRNPEPQASAYHIHIYFESGTADEQKAIDMAQRIDGRFPGAVKDAHRVGKIGPHTKANIGVTITPESFGEVVSWLQLNSQGLSILVHPRTGDELADHLDAAMWLGKPVPFNDKFFERLKPKNPKGPRPQ